MNHQEIYQQYFDFLYFLTNDQKISQSLSEQLAEFSQNMEAFRATHAEFLEELGDIEQDWQAIHFLIHHLEEQNYAYILDWKADSEEMNYALASMSKDQLKEVVDEEDEEDCDSMYDLIDIAIEKLEPLGYTLFHFPSEDDSYPVALVPKEKITKLEELSYLIF